MIIVFVDRPGPGLECLALIRRCCQIVKLLIHEHSLRLVIENSEASRKHCSESLKEWVLIKGNVIGAFARGTRSFPGFPIRTRFLFVLM